jgi:hypothetical protein
MYLDAISLLDIATLRMRSWEGGMGKSHLQAALECFFDLSDTDLRRIKNPGPVRFLASLLTTFYCFEILIFLVGEKK